MSMSLSRLFYSASQTAKIEPALEAKPKNSQTGSLFLQLFSSSSKVTPILEKKRKNDSFVNGELVKITIKLKANSLK